MTKNNIKKPLNVNRVFVLNANKQPLMPCHPKRARQLLNNGRAAVYRYYPFTIILKQKSNNHIQSMSVGIDSGAKTTGLALILHGKNGDYVVCGIELSHRTDIKKLLIDRSSVRRNRRNRKTRYRQSRFLNRKNNVGKLPPSLYSKVQNIITWVQRLRRYCPLHQCRLETAQFNHQQLSEHQNHLIVANKPNYHYYNTRQYIMARDRFRCVYCGCKSTPNNPFELDHVIAKSKGGSDSILNLVLSCHNCNQAKSNLHWKKFAPVNRQDEFNQNLKALLNVKCKSQMNHLRNFLIEDLQKLGLDKELIIGYGFETHANRNYLKHPKTHWIDAALCTEYGYQVHLDSRLKPLKIYAMGRGNRQMCLMNKYGFPRTSAKVRQKRIFGFQTGDIVLATVPDGFKTPKGRYLGRISIRKSGAFHLTTLKCQSSYTIPYRFCQIKHLSDGYSYST